MPVALYHHYLCSFIPNNTTYATFLSPFFPVCLIPGTLHTACEQHFSIALSTTFKAAFAPFLTFSAPFHLGGWDFVANRWRNSLGFTRARGVLTLTFNTFTTFFATCNSMLPYLLLQHAFCNICIISSPASSVIFSLYAVVERKTWLIRLTRIPCRTGGFIFRRTVCLCLFRHSCPTNSLTYSPAVPFSLPAPLPISLTQTVGW